MNKLVSVLAFLLPLTLPGLVLAGPNPAYPPAPAPGSVIKVEDTVYGVMRTHRTLRRMQENRSVLEHELDRAKRGFGPKVDIEAAGGYGVMNDSTTRDEDKQYGMYPHLRLSATLVQPIWDGFATRSRVRSAQSTLDSVKHRVFDNATSLSLDGIIAHINLMRCRALVQLAQDNLTIHERILSMAEARTNVGADTAADTTQAHSRHQRAISTLEEQKDALRVAEDTFTRLTGLPASSPLATVSMPPEVFSNANDCYNEAEKENPKAKAYMADIRAERAEHELAESAFYPTFNLEAGPSYSDYPVYAARDERWYGSFDIMLTMRWNIFNSGADLAEWKASSARIREARQLYLDFLDDLRLDVDTTWSNYLAAQQQYKHYTKAIEYNKFTLNAYNEQFQIGRRTLLDVLDSENELYNSSTQAETARANILIGAYRLLALTGTMLPKMSIDLTGLAKEAPVDPEDDRELFEKGWFE